MTDANPQRPKMLNIFGGGALLKAKQKAEANDLVDEKREALIKEQAEKLRIEKELAKKVNDEERENLAKKKEEDLKRQAEIDKKYAQKQEEKDLIKNALKLKMVEKMAKADNDINELKDKIDSILVAYNSYIMGIKAKEDIEKKIASHIKLLQMKKTDWMTELRKELAEFKLVKPGEEDKRKDRNNYKAALNVQKNQIIQTLERIRLEEQSEIPIEGETLKLENAKISLINSIETNNQIFQENFQKVVLELNGKIDGIIKAYKDAKKALTQFKKKTPVENPIIKVQQLNPFPAKLISPSLSPASRLQKELEQKENLRSAKYLAWKAKLKEVENSEENKKFQEYEKDRIYLNKVFIDSNNNLEVFLKFFKRLKEINANPVIRIPLLSPFKKATPKYISSSSSSPKEEPEQQQPLQKLPFNVQELSEEQRDKLADKIAKEKYPESFAKLRRLRAPNVHFALNQYGTDLDLDFKGQPKIAKKN